MEYSGMSQNGMIFENLITPEQLASEFNVAPKTLANWRALKKGPPSVKVGGKVFYKYGDVSNWLEDLASHSMPPKTKRRRYR